MMGRWLYRARQFFSAWGSVNKEDKEEAREVLGPDLYRIFSAMPRQYKLHSLLVYRRVREAGCDDPQVWQAALLHDSGKFDPRTGRSVTIAYRVVIVLLKATPPGKRLLESLASHDDPGGLLGFLFYPFYLSRHHARLGAEMAYRHGAAPEVAQLIADHHKQGRPNSALAALQAADERS